MSGPRRFGRRLAGVALCAPLVVTILLAIEWEAASAAASALEIAVVGSMSDISVRAGRPAAHHGHCRLAAGHDLVEVRS